MPISGFSVSDLFSLEGKKALLTGATAGIGRRFADVLAGAGATVGLVARRSELLDQMCADIPNTYALSQDLSVPGAGDRVAAWAMDTLGRVDVIVNNAGNLAKGRRAEDETDEDIRWTLDLNLVTPVRIVQGLFPQMRERGSGSIINVTSMVAEVGIGRFPQAIYSASKGGLSAITREWAAQWSRYGIRINNLAPGMIESEINQEVLKIDKIHDWVLRNTLLPRHGQPEDFDGALLLLASDAGRYITGQTITVDGGWTAR
jgi:NAD(P)-dependent dehydrogenase (short-subunit alcohol dehydrogenase family)